MVGAWISEMIGKIRRQGGVAIAEDLFKLLLNDPVGESEQVARKREGVFNCILVDGGCAGFR